jgi:hypothetical protein
MAYKSQLQAGQSGLIGSIWIVDCFANARCEWAIAIVNDPVDAMRLKAMRTS